MKDRMSNIVRRIDYLSTVFIFLLPIFFFGMLLLCLNKSNYLWDMNSFNDVKIKTIIIRQL
jgi:hypothetical protein